MTTSTEKDLGVDGVELRLKIESLMKSGLFSPVVISQMCGCSRETALETMNQIETEITRKVGS